jgi:hypothetical protein
LSQRGLLVARDNGANKVAALREVVAAITPYASVIARAVQNKEMIVPSAEVAAHWHWHFRPYTQFGILNYQIVCFFRVAEGADLGRLVVGRKGQHTRFELAEDDARTFIDGAEMPATMKLFKAFNEFTRSQPTRPLALAIGADHVVPHVLQYERVSTSVQTKN